MALGDQAGLQAVQTALAAIPGIEKFTDDERAQLTASVSKLMTDSISQAGSVIQADLAPVAEQLKAFNESLATAIGLLQSIRDDGIPYSGMLGGKRG